jgi:hypothetical protein
MVSRIIWLVVLAILSLPAFGQTSDENRAAITAALKNGTEKTVADGKVWDVKYVDGKVETVSAGDQSYRFSYITRLLDENKHVYMIISSGNDTPLTIAPLGIESTSVSQKISRLRLDPHTYEQIRDQIALGDRENRQSRRAERSISERIKSAITEAQGDTQETNAGNCQLTCDRDEKKGINACENQFERDIAGCDAGGSIPLAGPTINFACAVSASNRKRTCKDKVTDEHYRCSLNCESGYTWWYQ